jgi:hypothetical protein
MACQEIQISGGTSLSASGDAPDLSTPTQTDVTKQTKIPEVDILWVVDNSGSMAEEQDDLSTNFDAFINFFIGSGLDWHIGVVTTDTDARAKRGKLEPARDGTRFLTSTTPDPIVPFRQMVKVGTLGSPDERGLSASYLALAQPDPAIVTANEGFYREGAALHVVVVSDEEDTPGIISNPAEYANWLVGLKASPDIPVTFSSIVGPNPNGCSRLPEVDAVAGSRYIQVTDLVGGVFSSICTEDWYSVLEELGLQAAGLKREYFLTQVPVAETLAVVVVDGQEIHGINRDTVRDGADLDTLCDRRGFKACEWFYYDARRNAVVFPEYLPGALAEVNITYALRSAVEDVEDVVDSDAAAE